MDDDERPERPERPDDERAGGKGQQDDGEQDDGGKPAAQNSSRPAGHLDGRRERGRKRRAEIIDATLAVVTRDGAAGVTHRTVAKQADITTSLSTYYFATLDDLLVAALTSVADSYTDHIRRILDAPGDRLDGLVRLIVDSAGPGRDRALAERELATLAARRPALRPAARRWRENVAELGGTLTDNSQAIAALVAASDGLCTAVLLDDAPADPAHIRAVLDRAIGQPPVPDPRPT